MVRALLLVAVAGSLAHAVPVQHPVGVVAPKGKPPPLGSVIAAGSPYLYVAYIQSAGTHTAGAGAALLQSDPALGASDYHTLGEIAVESSDGQQIVEIGWTVDLAVNGDRQPHLFSFHWVDGGATCYNGCGWVQMSSTHSPGMRLTTGETHDYSIRLINGDWWLYFDNDAMGYYPGSLWTGRFSAMGFTQWFGEVSAMTTSPCTEMGNGKLGADTSSASFTTLRLYDPGPVAVTANAGTGTVTNAALYNIGRTTPTSFGFGGPGATTGCCTPSSCFGLHADCGAITDPTCSISLACGSCEGGAACSASNTCPGGPLGDAGVDVDAAVPDASPPSGPDAGTGLNSDDGGGCCDTGASPGAPAMLALVVLGLVLRRRYRSASVPEA